MLVVKPNSLLNEKNRLILSSLLMMFVEMMLIRWASSNVYQIFFFTNFVLIASFLGIGIGFLRVNQSTSKFYLSPILLMLIVTFCYLYSFDYSVKINQDTGNLNYYVSWFKDRAYPIFFTLPLLFVAIVTTMASLSDAVALSFQQFSALSAYRLEVLGTLSGIIIFSFLSFLQLSPLVWGMVIVSIYLLLFWDTWRLSITFTMLAQITSLILMLTVFSIETNTNNHIWSTYYKINVKNFAPDSYVVNVNGLAQQIIEPLAQRIKIKPFYIKPYEHMPVNQSLDNVLVIGAGTGGDVAIALAKGAKHVDAVEIDPALYQLGKKLNVNKPYDDERVSVYINDGRAFLQQTKNQYDLIIYALTDSLALIPGLSSVRLENYLYTMEGLSAAANHLKPNGIFTIYNYYGARWFGYRLANTLNLIYQHSPCIDSYGMNDDWATVLTISKNQNSLSCPTRWLPQNQAYENPATDNHPFIYLQENTLPLFYVFSLGLIACLAYFSLRSMGGNLIAIRQHFDLFLMGTAFLLLETKSVVSYALLFGTTWLVNSLVFIGILFSVYVAIEIVARTKQFNLFILYGLLLLSLMIAWIIPMSALLSYAPIIRFILATLITFTPILIANLIFAERFSDIAMSTQALGANLIGAVVGGLLEYSALAIGYEHFALIILVIYTLAFSWLIFIKQKVLTLTFEK